jgi:phosphatidylinositol 4-phosphatase
MPFIWNQSPDLKWSPKVTISDNDRLNCDVMKKNYDDILKNYENCALINLIDKKGSQKRLGEYFDKTHRNVDYSPVRLVWFDFHAECKNMKY